MLAHFCNISYILKHSLWPFFTICNSVCTILLHSTWLIINLSFIIYSAFISWGTCIKGGGSVLSLVNPIDGNHISIWKITLQLSICSRYDVKLSKLLDDQYYGSEARLDSRLQSKWAKKTLHFAVNFATIYFRWSSTVKNKQ